MTKQFPSDEAISGYMSELSNWGRWGADDVKGTLNFIDGEARVRAAGLIQRGETVSTSRDISSKPTPEQLFGPPLHLMLEEPFDLTTGEGRSYDYFGIPTHGYDMTHLDALRHNHFRGRMYNDRPKKIGYADRDDTFDVRGVSDGIFTRGILLDLPRHFGMEWMGGLEGVLPSELDDLLDAAGVELRSGDALIMRNGTDVMRYKQGLEMPTVLPGWHASTLPWLREHEISLIGCDSFCDFKPTPYTLRTPVHSVGVVAMGLTLVDNMELVPLAAKCAELGRWEFALSIAALPLQGGTGSPVNPIALF